MAIRDALASLFAPRPQVQQIEWLGSTFRDMILGLTPEELYRTQPHLRIVLSFVARNVAHLGLPVFERVSDTNRKRLRDDPMARLLARPNSTMTRFELIEALVSDLGLYDIAYWLVTEDTNAPAGWSIVPIPPTWVVSRSGGTVFEAGKYKIQNPGGQIREVDAEDMLVFHGWNPGKPKDGTSPVDTLKQILAEQVQAWAYRQQVWQRGGRVGAVITRPAGNPWSDTARERFITDWKAAWTGNGGAKAGGTPILEDGMTINRLGFSAREDEWAEVSKVALSTVAGVYHVNPVMVGILDNANFSNTKEFRKMLYSETLGPTLARIEDRINAFLVPKITKTPGVYVEFNIEEKLQGDFEEQGAILQTATGAPWMTRNEARALRNLPEVAGGDELVVPLNVLIGGQASPRDSAPKGKSLENIGELRVLDAKSEPVTVKATVGANDAVQADRVLQRFFRRQRDVVLKALDKKSPEWWDEERWDKELTDDLLALGVTLSSATAHDVLRRVGVDPDLYDEGATVAFLRAVARSRAGAINSTTRDQVSAVLNGSGPEGVTDPGHVFDVATSSRAEAAGLTLATTFATFGTVEAGKQSGAGSKQWLVTSSNPRPEHAAMSGETVPIGEKFSNGADWPGDPVLGADGVANCSCVIQITYG